jgi:hypothetical protein
MASLFDLSGRVGVVMGATSGLGRAIAIGLAQHGAEFGEILAAGGSAAPDKRDGARRPARRDRADRDVLAARGFHRHRHARQQRHPQPLADHLHDGRQAGRLEHLVDVYKMGYYGSFNGTEMMRIKQVHTVGTYTFKLSENDIYVLKPPYRL